MLPSGVLTTMVVVIVAELSGCVLVSGMSSGFATRSAGHTRTVGRGLPGTRHDATLDERFDFDGYDQLAAELWREFRNVGWWFDTSALTPGETDCAASENSKCWLVRRSGRCAGGRA